MDEIIFKYQKFSLRVLLSFLAIFILTLLMKVLLLKKECIIEIFALSWEIVIGSFLKFLRDSMCNSYF